MKQITVEQLQKTIDTLSEMQAKHSFDAITMLLGLPDVPEVKEETKK